MLTQAALGLIILAAAGNYACGGEKKAREDAEPRLRAAEAVARLPKSDAEVARVMISLERGLHDGDVRLLCERVYDPRDTGSATSCQTTLAGLAQGDDQLTISPRRVDRHGGSAVIRADVTRGGESVPEQQVFRVRRVPKLGWRVHLVL